jgi:hypothetical protein
MNLYAYSGNNPATYTDPFGLCPMCLVVGGRAVKEVAEGYGIARLSGAEYRLRDAAVDALGGAIGAGLLKDLTGVGRWVARFSDDAADAFGNLRALKTSRLRNLGIDAEKFKDDIVPGAGSKFNIATNEKGQVFLTPVQTGKNAPDPLETGYTIDQLPEIYPLGKRN